MDLLLPIMIIFFVYQFLILICRIYKNVYNGITIIGLISTIFISLSVLIYFYWKWDNGYYLYPLYEFRFYNVPDTPSRIISIHALILENSFSVILFPAINQLENPTKKSFKKINYYMFKYIFIIYTLHSISNYLVFGTLNDVKLMPEFENLFYLTSFLFFC